ncbi:MAG: hypothetical protein JZU70_09615 [Chlorobium sp.]|jgi:hypothetical protein|nr:hypothetical protein [Chlorobium sp.]
MTQEENLKNYRSIIDDVVSEAEKPAAKDDTFFLSSSNEQKNVHHVHHVHRSESTQELKNAELEKHVATVDSIIERAKDNAGLYASAEFIEAMKFIRDTDDEAWIRCRVKIKREKPSGVLLSDIDDATRPDSESAGERNVSAAIIKLVVDRCELSHDTNTRDAYVTTKADNVTLKVGSTNFTEWVSHEYYKDSGHSSASDAAVKQASSALSGLCKFEGKQERVFIRAAKHEETGAYFLFMDDGKNRAIEITITGWRILDLSPVRFWKPSSSAALPEPVAGGDVNKLWEFCNIPEEYRLLVLAWLLECYRVDTPFPLLEINGVQGSAKSTTEKNLRMVVDPSTVNLRSAPKNVEDIYVCAGNNHLLAYENLSYLPAKYQDAFCTIATGGGAGGRALFTNGEEFLVEVKRPIIINGIPSLITAQDLTERSIHLELPRVERYLCEGDLLKGFDAALPVLFGGLLDLFVKTLSILPTVKLARPPRMVDFCHLGEAMAQSMGHKEGTFLELYNENRKESVIRSIESSPIASAILDMAQESAFETVFHGTYKELLDKLIPYKSGDNEGWPKSEKGLANALKRNIPALHEADVIVLPEQGKKQGNKGRTVTIKKCEHGARREHDSAKTSSKEKKLTESVDDGRPF